MRRTRRATTIGCALAVMATGCRGLRAQESSDSLGARFAARTIMVRQDSRIPGHAWAPGAELSVRLPLTSFLTGEVAFSDVRTRRLESFVCAAALSTCPPPRNVSGWTTTLAGALEATLVVGRYTAFSGIGYGRLWDWPPSGLDAYGGPMWLGTWGLERRFGRTVGLELTYRLLRVSWQNQYALLQGIHFTHHEFALGVTLAPWSKG